MLPSSAAQEVVFTQLDKREYRDAVRFANGHELSLQKLREGQRVLVLALSLEPVEDMEEALTNARLEGSHRRN